MDIVESKTRVLVADLGFAKQLDHSEALAETRCGTLLQMAPELLKGEPYSMKADVWSFGCIFYEMITGLPPFTGIN